METIQCISSRKSVRLYKKTPIDYESLNEMIQAAVMAPSGRNGMPWRFVIISNDNIKNKIEKLLGKNIWIKTAPSFILVFLNLECMYDYIKDVQSCGAAIQNILLVAHAKGIGACWVGEVREYQDEILNILNLSKEKLELMALITVGISKYYENKITNVNISDYIINIDSKTNYINNY